MDDHDLTAAYALDALDADERARFEAHLAACERCREELQRFWQVGASLARAAGGAPPPPQLRDRILTAARNESQNVVPLRPRRTTRMLGAVAAVAAAVAVGLGVWGVSVSSDLSDAERTLAVLGDPDARTIPAADGRAALVVTPEGDAALVVRSLAPAPDGRDYEIWVLDDGAPQRAGLFERPGVAMLTRPVHSGQTVAVTLEADGGVDAPTGEPIFTADAT